ncbi:MAG: transposase, partial [Planctomycetes bacterium]|nr:transposase [Planctomycetota bacterium]
ARGWSLEQTARVFHLSAATVASWMKRLDEEGADALVQLREPVNRFPDFVRYLVQRLKTLCPSMGKKKLAQTLARAGLHLGTTTVGRILKEKPAPTPQAAKKAESAGRVVTAKRPQMGFWTSWFPFALPQRWPFCWWVAVVVDHFSRRAMGIGVFAKRPDCRTVCVSLGQLVRRVGTAPKYIICDQDSIFDCPALRRWVKRKGIRPPRYGAIGEHGSIAGDEVVERFILTMKNESTRRYLVALRRETFRGELVAFIDWYNEYRPHTTLGGKTPEEVYHHRYPANRRPRIEPRQRWPRGAPCAKPQTLIAGKSGQRFEMVVNFHKKQRHLPVVKLNRAA